MYQSHHPGMHLMAKYRVNTDQNVGLPYKPSLWTTREEDEVTFRLFLSYWRPTWAPISPVSFSGLLYWRMSWAGVSTLPSAVCVCIIVYVSQEALGVSRLWSGGGVPWFLHICKLHFSRCWSVVFNRVRGVSPISLFFKLSYILPLIAHNKLPEVHTLLWQEARQRYPATPDRGSQASVA